MRDNTPTHREIIEDLTEALEACKHRLECILGHLDPHNYDDAIKLELHSNVPNIKWCLKEAACALAKAYEWEPHDAKGTDVSTREESTTHARAQRVADTLNEFVGALHSAHCTGTLWLKHTENPSYRHTAKYGLQGAFLITALTLRKLEDLWEHHICQLLPKTATSSIFCEQLIADCRARNLRKTANRIIAHYAANKKDWPLSSGEIQDLIRSNGWDTEEEALRWAGGRIPGIISIRDELRHCYKLEHLRDEEG